MDTTTTQAILVAYGMIALTYGAMLGAPMATGREKAPTVSRHLVTTHLSGLIQGGIALGLAVAVSLAAADSGWSVAGAALVAAGSALELAGGTMNWRHDVGDQFAEKSVGLALNKASTMLFLPGLLILLVVVLSGL